MTSAEAVPAALAAPSAAASSSTAPAAPPARAPRASAAARAASACAVVAKSEAFRSSRFIQAGDLVIVFISRDRTPIPLRVTPGEEYTNSWGTFQHADMVGKPFGSRVRSLRNTGYLFLLRPTPELWTLALPHRTQILYAPDMSFITLKLALTPGSRIIEAGTGSGSFTHFLARTVGRARQWDGGRGWQGDGAEMDERDARDGGIARGTKRKAVDGDAAEAAESQPVEPIPSDPDPHVEKDDGRVWSFEFNATRAQKAKSEFEAHGLTRTVSLRHRNVCRDGFGLSNVADCVFLDLPAPWDALESAAEALRLDVAGRVCCFSPCIEQVLRTADTLRKQGWCEIETFESLVRNHESLTQARTAPLVPVSDAISKIREVERNKSQRRLGQIERSRRARIVKERAAELVAEGMPEAEAEAKAEVETAQTEDLDEEMEDPRGDVEEAIATATPWTVKLPDAREKERRELSQANVYSRTLPDMRGHTSYLTFATLRPRVLSNTAPAQASNGSAASQPAAPATETAAASTEAVPDDSVVAANGPADQA